VISGVERKSPLEISSNKAGKREKMTMMYVC
jgi:hypothetical protein